MTDLGQVTNSVLCLGNQCQNTCLSHRGITDLNFTDSSTVRGELKGGARFYQCKVENKCSCSQKGSCSYKAHVLTTVRKSCMMAKSYSLEFPYPSLHQNYSDDQKLIEQGLYQLQSCKIGYAKKLLSCKCKDLLYLYRNQYGSLSGNRVIINSFTRRRKVFLLAKFVAVLKGNSKNRKGSLLDLHKITVGWISLSMNGNFPGRQPAFMLFYPEIWNPRSLITESQNG